MTIDRLDIGHVTILSLGGRLTDGLTEDTNTALFFRKVVIGLQTSGRSYLILVCGKLRYMDSSGIGELVASFTRSRNLNGDVVIVEPTKKIRDILELAKIRTVFERFGSVPDALKHFGEIADRGVSFEI